MVYLTRRYRFSASHRLHNDALSGEANVRMYGKCDSPFGHGHDVRIVMDQDLCRYQSVWAAAGTDSAFFQIAPRTLRMLSNAVVAQVAKEFRRSAAAAPPIQPRLRFEVGTGA